MHDPAAAWLREIKKTQPQRFREVARRHPVLSAYQVDARKRGETELHEAEEDGQGGYRPGTLDALIHRDWLAVAFQEAA